MSYTEQEIARVCHEANRALQRINGDLTISPPWDDAPEWMQESAVNGVVNARRGCTPEESHENWTRERLAAGWEYGPVKDEKRFTHPCLVPYDELPPGERVKDSLFVSIVHALARL